MKYYMFVLFQGNPTLKAKDKADALFQSEEKFRYIQVLFEPKNADDDNILTPEAFEEFQGFWEILRDTTEYKKTKKSATGEIERPSSGETVSFEEICSQVTFPYTNDDGETDRTECMATGPLAFTYNVALAQNDLSKVKTEDQIINLINSGVGDE